MIEEEKPSDISSTESPAPEAELSDDEQDSFKLMRLMIHLQNIGHASDSLIKGARPAGASGLQTLVLSADLVNLARAVGAAGRAFTNELKQAKP